MIRTYAGITLIGLQIFARCCLADTSSNVVVQSSMFPGLGGPFDCVMQSSGAPVTCTSGIATAMGMASASFSSSGGEVSTEASAGAFANIDSALANASAEFDYLVVVNSLAGSTLVGSYAFSAGNNGFFCCDPYLLNSISIQQGTASDANPSTGPSQPLTLQSTVQPGVPFEERVVISSYASTPDDESAEASVEFDGFKDLAGNSVPYVIVSSVPESSTFSLMLVAGLALIFRRRCGIK